MIPRLKGTDDILPPDSAKWRILLRAFDDLSAKYGYDLALMPVLESTGCSRGVGAGTEVVEKQMYTFVDRGGRSVTLRPEFTAGIVRAYLESGGNGVMKVAASGPQFRYEQPQKGGAASSIRSISNTSESRVREPTSRSSRCRTSCLSQSGCPVSRCTSTRSVTLPTVWRTAKLLRDFLRSVAAELSADARKRIEDNPLRVLDSKIDADIVASAPVPLDHLGSETAAHFAAVRAGLDEAGIPYEVAPRLVRGLDYYNRTVFELFSTAFEAAQSSLGGGGRYDPLGELIGAKHPVPAVGVALGCDRIVAAMLAPAGPRLDLFVAVAAEARIVEAGAGSVDSRGRTSSGLDGLGALAQGPVQDGRPQRGTRRGGRRRRVGRRRGSGQGHDDG